MLWNQEREAELQAFLDSSPHLSDFEEKFRFYDELEEHILSEPDITAVGPVVVHTGKYCTFLVVIRPSHLGGFVTECTPTSLYLSNGICFCVWLGI